MRIWCIFLSILLHVSVVLWALYMPQFSPAVRLDVPIYTMKLVSMPTKMHGEAKFGAPPAPTAKKAPKESPKKEAAKEASKPKVEAKPESKPEIKPEPKPDTVLLPKEKKPEPKPEPKPEEKKVEKKVEKKPEPKKEPKPKPKKEVKKEKKLEPKKAPKPAKKAVPKKPQKPKLSDEELLQQALALADNNVKKAQKERERKDAEAMAKELEALRASVAADDAVIAAEGATAGGSGEGGTTGGEGVGLADIYTVLVKEQIRTNWNFPMQAERINLVCTLRIQLGADGSVLDVQVEEGSGRADYDSSTVQAVEKTDNLPPPPLPEMQDLRISFNLQEML